MQQQADALQEVTSTTAGRTLVLSVFGMRAGVRWCGGVNVAAALFQPGMRGTKPCAPLGKGLEKAGGYACGRPRCDAPGPGGGISLLRRPGLPKEGVEVLNDGRNGGTGPRGGGVATAMWAPIANAIGSANGGGPAIMAGLKPSGPAPMEGDIMAAAICR